MASDVFEPFGRSEEEREAQQADGQQEEDRGDVHQFLFSGVQFSDGRHSQCEAGLIQGRHA